MAPFLGAASAAAAAAGSNLHVKSRSAGAANDADCRKAPLEGRQISPRSASIPSALRRRRQPPSETRVWLLLGVLAAPRLSLLSPARRLPPVSRPLLSGRPITHEGVRLAFPRPRSAPRKRRLEAGRWSGGGGPSSLVEVEVERHLMSPSLECSSSPAGFRAELRAEIVAMAIENEHLYQARR